MGDALYCVFMSARLPLTIKRFTYLLTYLEALQPSSTAKSVDQNL